MLVLVLVAGRRAVDVAHAVNIPHNPLVLLLLLLSPEFTPLSTACHCRPTLLLLQLSLLPPTVTWWPPGTIRRECVW